MLAAVQAPCRVGGGGCGGSLSSTPVAEHTHAAVPAMCKSTSARLRGTSSRHSTNACAAQSAVRHRA